MAPKRGRNSRAKTGTPQVTTSTIIRDDVFKATDWTITERIMLDKLAKAVTHEVADEAISKHYVLKVIDSLATIAWGELATIGRFNLPGLLRMTGPPPLSPRVPPP